AEHRALEAGRADVDAKEIEEIVGAERLDGGHGIAPDLVGQEACAGLADRPAAAGEPDALDDAVADPQLERDPVAAERIAALEGRGRIVDDPEVMGSPVGLEDVVAGGIVHPGGSVAERPALIPSDFVGIDARRDRPTRQSMARLGAVSHRNPAGWSR